MSKLGNSADQLVSIRRCFPTRVRNMFADATRAPPKRGPRSRIDYRRRNQPVKVGVASTGAAGAASTAGAAVVAGAAGAAVVAGAAGAAVVGGGL